MVSIITFQQINRIPCLSIGVGCGEGTGRADASALAPECIAGEILKGLKKPPECPAYGTKCTPERPLGAPMVSSEGACAAYYLYARHE